MSFNCTVEQDVQRWFDLGIFSEHYFSFLKMNELAIISSFFKLIFFKVVKYCRLLYDFPDEILFDNILETISQAGFNVLSTHWHDFTFGFGD
jgi:hypothetical protein